ncbi:MAG: hypothetical protein K1X57_07035 [Gemmataceae bacterium]|nr:hypothetical protein [Gemmataceae bacterium]
MNAYRWLIPLGLGLVAGVSHYFVLKGATRTVAVLVAADNLKPGELLTEDRATIITIRLDGPPQYLDSHIPVDGRHSFFEFPLRRAIGKGEPILRADVAVTAQRIDLRDGESPVRLAVGHSSRLPEKLDVGMSLKLRHSHSGVHGPYRLLGITGSEVACTVILAVPDGDPLVTKLPDERKQFAAGIASVEIAKPRQR